MEEKIERKIEGFIESILEKETLTKDDYEILSSHLSKMKYEKENKKRMENMLNAFISNT